MVRAVFAFFAALLIVPAGPAAAQATADNYPSKRIVIVVPFAVASGIDQLAREHAELLRAQLNTPVVVENKEGAGGIIGASAVAHAQPDGYTLLITANPPFAMAPQMQKEAPYDPVSSFSPVVRLGAVPLVLVTSNTTPFKTYREFADYAKANPGKLNYAASGVGSPGQLYTQLLMQATGLHLQEVLYKSTGQALTDAISGVVQVSLVSIPAAAAQIKSGNLRALAVGSTERLKQFPDIPTIAELIGKPTFEASVWYGILAPAGTPADVVNKLQAAFAKTSVAPQMVQFMERSSIAPQLQGPAAFAATVRNDTAAAGQIVASQKIRQ
jgi:tripartite-type tricarboxylate transporter receptor subunit TctC